MGCVCVCVCVCVELLDCQEQGDFASRGSEPGLGRNSRVAEGEPLVKETKQYTAWLPRVRVPTEQYTAWLYRLVTLNNHTQTPQNNHKQTRRFLDKELKP